MDINYFSTVTRKTQNDNCLINRLIARDLTVNSAKDETSTDRMHRANN